MITKICRWCGKEFTAKNNTAQFCSEDCRAKNRKEWCLAYYRKKTYTIKCAWCGESFTTERKTRYCCNLCRLRATGKIKGIAKTQKNKPVKSIEEVAKICGELKITYGQYMTRKGGDL